MPQARNGREVYLASIQCYFTLIGRAGGSKIVPSGMEQYMLSGELYNQAYHSMTRGFS